MKKAFIFFWSLCFTLTLIAQESENPAETSPTQTPPQETTPIPASQPAPTPSEKTPQPTTSKPTASDSINEQRLLQMIANNPTDRTAYNRLLEYYKAKGLIQDHLKILIKAIQNIGGNLSYYIAMGDDYIQLQDYSKALISYQYALKESPKNPVVYLKLGNVHLLQKNYYSAETALLAALYYGGNSGQINVALAYRMLGQCYEGVKNYVESLKWYQKSYQLEPSSENKALVERIQSMATNR